MSEVEMATKAIKWLKANIFPAPSVGGVPSQPTLVEFFRIAWNDVGARMSGIFSVPFGAATVFADSTKTQLIWLCLAVAALFVGAYRVWSIERKKVVVLAQRLEPTLKATFDPKDPGCRRDVPSRLPNGTDVTTTYYRLRVSVDASTPLTGCRARLVAVTRDTETVFQGENLVLPFAHTASDGAGVRIDPGIPEYMDLIVLLPGDQVVIATPRLPHSVRNFEAMFSEHGVYTFRIVISALNGPPITVQPKLVWRGTEATMTVA